MDLYAHNARPRSELCARWMPPPGRDLLRRCPRRRARNGMKFFSVRLAGRVIKLNLCATSFAHASNAGPRAGSRRRHRRLRHARTRLRRGQRCIWRNMHHARTGPDGLARWVEVCYCPTPLQEERPYRERFFELDPRSGRPRPPPMPGFQRLRTMGLRRLRLYRAPRTPPRRTRRIVSRKIAITKALIIFRPAHL